ncbi:stalk domain-containing protein [Paenibacillus spongiae]|uniref:Copper amine oxidase-like N-terminal domain-containing protein n=1 Tax=Paenibacillus spongiae TaxID=2909671 RepID=A0ABY5S9V5_9BACL|nr:stalk domain-containing protein [Paenibacillus spongiae]UVI29325.1 hypothetical protein L1F29_28500 [Paenibacillus spongiae]
MKKRLLVLFTALCLMIALVPAAVGAAAQPVVIQLTVGSPTVTINGASSTIQKPYQINGTTLVPLSVITKAFGAGLQLEKNKIITLAYNDTKVVLTIGSKQVLVNGKATTIAVEPKVVNNTTMVPLRVIAQSFGATITTSGKQITIVGFRAGGGETGGQTGNTGGINPDAGKTKVGDSYYGWSVNYPSDLSLSEQSDNGNVAVWSDANGNPSLIVTVVDVGQTYTREEVREHLLGYFAEDEFAVEKKTVDIGGLSFEKIVSRSRNGWFFEYRGIQKENRIYTIMSGVKAASRDALDKYQPLLDSFKLKFSKADASLKDITKVKDGFMVVSDRDYGLTVQLPADWGRDSKAPYPLFGNEDTFMEIHISSAKKDETAEQWMKKERAKLEAQYAPGYLRNIAESNQVLEDGKAAVLTLEYSFDKKNWSTSHDIYLIAGNHRYYVTLYYPSGSAAKAQSAFKQVLATLDFDIDYVEANFSEMEEEEGLESLTVTKTSKTYGYSIDIPQSWSGVDKDFEKDAVTYNGSYGTFSLGVYDDATVSGIQQSVQTVLTQNEDFKSRETRVIGTSQVTIAGQTATKIEAEALKSDHPLNSTFYIFEKNGRAYLLEFHINQANDTAAFRDLVDKILKSFKFTS